MRKLTYDVIDANGNKFTTSSYSKAFAKGNKIEKTYLVPMPEYSEEYYNELREHAKKVWKKWRGGSV